MKEFIVISGIFPNKVHPDLYDALRAIFPDTPSGAHINVRLPKEDPRIAEALQTLQKWKF